MAPSQAQRLFRRFNEELGRTGWQVARAHRGAQFDVVADMRTSFMERPDDQQVLRRELAALASPALSSVTGSQVEPEALEGLIDEFFSLYASRPFRENNGGSGFHNSFWLFLSTRLIAPDRIIESGVWHGHGTWLMRQACPDAEIIGFDLDLTRLEVGPEVARFVEGDWSSVDLEVNDEVTLGYFDCHVNHARRIIEASERGLRHLIFDDNPPLARVYSFGEPSVPSAHMVWHGEGLDRTEVRWTWHGRQMAHRIDPDEIRRARTSMESYTPFPDLGAYTRFGGFNYLAHVALRP